MSIFKILLYPRGNDIDIYQEMVLLPKTFNIMTEKMKNLDVILKKTET